MVYLEYDIDVMRGCDEKYTYEFTRKAQNVDNYPDDMTFENSQHVSRITDAKIYGVGYRRWRND